MASGYEEEREAKRSATGEDGGGATERSGGEICARESGRRSWPAGAGA